MKKYLFLFLVFFSAVGSVFGQVQQIMNHRNGYYYDSPKSLRNLSFQDITAPYSLGSSAVSINYWRGNFIFNNVSFLRNKNGLTVIEGIANITDGLFADNRMSGIYILSYNGNGLKLNRTSFNNNRAENGAGIFSSMTTSKSGNTFSEVSFNNNIATQKGGAMYLYLDKQEMQDVSFNANQATLGGAIYANNSFTITGHDIRFENNTAQLGGAIYAQNHLVLSGGNIVFSGNNANQGSAIYALQKLTLRAENGNIVFTSNAPRSIYTGNLLQLQPTSTGNIIFDDVLADGLRVRLEGDGSVFFNKKTNYLSGTFLSGGVYFNPLLSWNDSVLDFQGGSLLLADGKAAELALNQVTLHSSLTLWPEVDVQAGKMDSLSIPTLSGEGALKVSGFVFLTSDPDAPVTLHFAEGQAKNAVQTVTQAQDDVWRYQVSYNPQQGDITFTPMRLLLSGAGESVRPFVPATTIQPLMAYMTADGVLRMLARHGDLRRQNILRYDEPKSGFYLQPFYQKVRTDFINDASAQNTALGMSLGWFSDDWEWFSETLASGGWYFNAQQEDISSEAGHPKQTYYQLGGDLFFNSYNFFLGISAQGGLVRRSSHLSDTLLTGGIGGMAGFNTDLSASEYFLQPYVSYAYSYVCKGKDKFHGAARLTSQNFFLHQLQGAARLAHIHSDSWNSYIEAAYVKPFASQTAFYVADYLLPVFETQGFPQFAIGFKHDTEKRGISADIKASLGAVKSWEASVSWIF